MLLLGARGRLGSAFVREYDSQFEIVEVGTRERPAFGSRPYFSSERQLFSFLEKWQPEIVINAAAKWGSGVSETEIWDSNFQFPRAVASKLRAPGIRWLQVDSYFNLYFEEHSVDKDFYSLTKREFFKELSQNFPGVASTQIFAPHLVGEDEPPHRLFGSIVRCLTDSEELRLGSGDQYVPFLHLKDAVLQINDVVSHFDNLSDDYLVQLKSKDVLTVREIVSSAQKLFGIGGNPRFGSLPDAHREFYKPPIILNQFEWLTEPSRSIDTILLEIEASLGGFKGET